MIEEEEEKDNCRAATVYGVVEEPPIRTSRTDDEGVGDCGDRHHETVDSESCSDCDVSGTVDPDVMEIDNYDTDIGESENPKRSNSVRVPSPEATVVDDAARIHASIRCEPISIADDARHSPSRLVSDSKKRKSRGGRRSRRARGRRQQMTPSPSPTAAAPFVERGTWYVRWTRDGFENLVYAVCNCNEVPNVVFAGLYYQRAHVYTMVLRNCNGKRRYWYDVSTRSGRFEHVADDRSDDFERSIAWRSKAVARTCTTPGYDLASFALQNVNTDGRSYDGTAPPLIVITTGDMLTDASISRQLVCSDNELDSYGGGGGQQISTRYYIDRRTRRTPAGCRFCRKTAKTVMQDNASMPTCLCWDHAVAYMTASSADRTRVYGAVLLDLRFVRNTKTAELSCLVRLIKHDTPYSTRPGDTAVRSGTVTIAELVLSRPGQPSPYRQHEAPDYGMSVGLETAHADACRDMHYDDGDLFPSMPSRSVGGGSTAGAVRYHDTTLGRSVDTAYCVVSKFQK